MSKITSREIRLTSRPKGVPTADNFTQAQTELQPLQDQQVLVRNLFMSVDPYMRGRMNAGKSYVPPFELGNLQPRRANHSQKCRGDRAANMSALSREQ